MMKAQRMDRWDILPMNNEHGAEVLRIYAEAIAEGTSTYVSAQPAWEDWDAAHICKHRLVASCNGRIIGFVALSPLYRPAYYRGVVELSIYVDRPFRRRGIGLTLLNALLRDIRGGEFWTLHAYIFADNFASIRLHERAGFAQAGLYRNLGHRNGLFKDIRVYEYRLHPGEFRIEGGVGTHA
ncbi:MAG: GNAT family N-acetyltransferase [Peptococcaceae bacterium]|jgi:phosphinothricin acetyltransferase|nr:GNAT family N-acetyltransferase [Peptococcaceae bacterium]